MRIGWGCEDASQGKAKKKMRMRKVLPYFD